MKSAVFYGRHDLRVEERPIPEVGPQDVLIQVKACGVCGTDVHIFEGDKGAAEVTPPTILGHEFSGIVVKTGDSVKRWKPGDRVCIDPNSYCGACTPCRSGEVHFCEHMKGYGTTVDGGFAQYCAVNEKQVYRLGEHTSFEMGAMAEPVACCLHGIDMCGIRPGSQAVVIGGGMIGLLMLQLTRLAGAAKVALLEPVEEKRRMAEKLGASLCIDPIHEDAGKALRNAGFTWVHTVIECVGKPSTIEQAVELAGSRAVVMMFGLTKPDETISIKPFQVFQKELVLKSSYINPCTQQRALDLIDSGRLDVSSMICGICGLEKLSSILEDPTLRAKGKFIISPEK
mgnify:FL=1